MRNNVILRIRISSELKQSLEQRAKAQNLQLSDYLRLILKFSELKISLDKQTRASHEKNIGERRGNV